MRSSRKIKIIFIIIMVIFCASFLFARAGGAGGSREGGGEGMGYLIYILIRIIIALPFPANIIVGSIIVIVFIVSTRKKRQASILNKLPNGTSVNQIKGYNTFIKNNPYFNRDAFKEKVKTAFVEIQKAWEAQDAGKVRKFLSDGVYQRFNTQFKMMKILKQRNTIDKLDVKNIYLDKIETDGVYDIIHVGVHAFIVDKFISEIDSSLNSGGPEEFVEYWSFLKKRGVQEKDLFNTNNCPNCGADLPEKLGEISKCEFCNTLTNSGDFDWVLSEITQADDYIGTHPRLRKNANLPDKLKSISANNKDFSVQLVEDKAANGYLQILTAIVEQDPSIMRRFVSDSAFEKFRTWIGSDPVVYNRIYLNDVTLIAAGEKEGKNLLVMSVKSSFQRVKLKKGRAVKLDETVVSRNNVLIMSRDGGEHVSNGSLYSHNCPNCGGTIGDTLDINCSFCGSLLNSTAREWIIMDIMSLSEYHNYIRENRSEFSFKIDPVFLDKMYDVRDFALNNVIVMTAIDGHLDEREILFVKKLAKKWGFGVNKLEPMFKMSSRLKIKMPENRKQRLRIYQLMEKAALADKKVAESEERLLARVKSEFLEERSESRTPWF